MKQKSLFYIAAIISIVFFGSCGQSSQSIGVRVDTAGIIKDYLAKKNVPIAEKLFADIKTGSEDTVQSDFLTARKSVRYNVTPQGVKIDSVRANQQINSYMKNNPNAVKSYYFSASVISQFIQKGAVYIKVFAADSYAYLQTPADGESFSLIVVGIDQNGNYIMLDGSDLNPADNTVKYVYNNVAPCPYACGSGHMQNPIIDNTH